MPTGVFAFIPVIVVDNLYLHDRKGLTGAQAEFAVKKYRSHRRIGQNIMLNIAIHDNPA